jgi:hypothetical protein
MDIQMDEIQNEEMVARELAGLGASMNDEGTDKIASKLCIFSNCHIRLR